MIGSVRVSHVVIVMIGRGGILTTILLFHHLIMALRCRLHQGLILIGREARQLLKERDHVPNERVIVRLTPGSHASGLDAVLYDPELLGRCQVVAASKLGRGRIEALRYFGPLHTRSQMTGGTHLGVEPGACSNPGWIRKIGWWWNIPRMGGDRPVSCRFKQPIDWPGVGIISRHIINP